MIPQHFTHASADSPQATVESFVELFGSRPWCYWYAMTDEKMLLLCAAIEGVGTFPVYEFDEPANEYVAVLLPNSIGMGIVNRMNLERFEIWPNEAHDIAQSTVPEN